MSKLKCRAILFTPTQFEQMFGISKAKQTRLRFRRNYTTKYTSKTPPLPYVRIGKSILYSLTSVQEWLKTQEIQ